MDLRIEDLYWLAGFLEGEGSFGRCGGTVQVTATQVQREPIDRIFSILKVGNISIFLRKEVTGNTYHRWCCYGEHAELLMKILYPIMSPRRKDQINQCLSWYATRPGKNYVKSGRKTCRKGLHRWIPENLGHKKNGVPFCIICDRENKNKWQRAKRANDRLILSNNN